MNVPFDYHLVPMICIVLNFDTLQQKNLGKKYFPRNSLFEKNHQKIKIYIKILPQLPTIRKGV